MSKASDFNDRMTQVKPQRPSITLPTSSGRGQFRAEVSDGGNLEMSKGVETIGVQADEALQLARWILDTFE